MTNGRTHENAIRTVEDEGKIIYRDEDKRDYFYSHFKALFASNESDRLSIGLEQFIL